MGEAVQDLDHMSMNSLYFKFEVFFQALVHYEESDFYFDALLDLAFRTMVHA